MFEGVKGQLALDFTALAYHFVTKVEFATWAADPISYQGLFTVMLGFVG